MSTSRLKLLILQKWEMFLDRLKQYHIIAINQDITPKYYE